MRNWILALAGAAYFIMAAPPEPSHNPSTEHAVLMQAPQEVAPTTGIFLGSDGETPIDGQRTIAFIHADPTSETTVALFMVDPTSGVLMNEPSNEAAEPIEVALALLGRHQARV